MKKSDMMIMKMCMCMLTCAFFFDAFSVSANSLRAA